jgi:predicted AlkP superfamily phosphohydrolase/phosphomutase
MSARRLVIGWDGADAAIVRDLLDRGDLPHLASLRAKGGFGTLAPLRGLADDAHWATFSTGVGPGVHGRFHHLQFDPGIDAMAAVTRDRMITPPFWEELARAGADVAILDVPKSPLADAGCRQIVDWMPHGEDGENVVGTPQAFLASARKTLPPIDFAACHRYRPGAESEALLDDVIPRVRTRSTVIGRWLSEQPWHLLMAVFAESHCVGHHCWHGHDDSHRQRPEWTRPNDPVAVVLRAMDDALGALIAAAGTSAETVVFAPIGMAATEDPTDVVAALIGHLDRALTDAMLRRSTSWRRRWAATLRRPARPTWVVRTAPHDAISSVIRINAIGRETFGAVAVSARSAVLDRISTELTSLTDATTGVPLISEVIATASAYPGPRSDALADLIAVWNPEWATDGPTIAALSPTFGPIDAPVRAARTGNHRAGGWFVSSDGSMLGRPEEAIALTEFTSRIRDAVKRDLDPNRGDE